MDVFIDNDAYEGGEDKDMAAGEAGNVIAMEKAARPAMRPAFACWEVGNGKKLQLKLTTEQTMELEKKFRKNLISLLGDEDNIPPLTTMLQVIHAAALPWKHGIKLKDIIRMYDEYQENGGSQLDLYVTVYMQIFVVSGFFSPAVAQEMAEGMAKAAEEL